VSVCWGRGPRPVGSEGLALLSAVLQVLSVFVSQGGMWNGIKWWQLGCTLEVERRELHPLPN